MRSDKITGVKIHHQRSSRIAWEKYAQLSIVPRVGMVRSTSPRRASVISNPIAHDILLIKVEKINGVVKGIYSFKTSLTVPVPESKAVLVKSRSRKLRTIERIRRASHGQPKTASINPSTTRFMCSRTIIAIMTKIRKSGITSRLSPIKVSTRSTVPPLYPATRPTRMAIALEITAEIREMIKELRTAKVACQKTSCPFESVPSQCSADG